MPSLLWLFSDRGTRRQNQHEDTEYWDAYRRASEAAGLEFLLDTPQAVDFEAAPCDRLRVYLREREIDPEQVVIGGDIYHFPHQTADIWPQLCAYACLRNAGFYVPLPSHLNLPYIDKLSSYFELRKLGVEENFAKCMRIATSRDFSERVIEERLAGWKLPVIAKPASWAGGMGVFVCENIGQVLNYLKLASGMEIPVLIQECIDVRNIRDIRVFLVEGMPSLVTERRPRPGGAVANVGRGGSLQVIELPQALKERARRLSAALGGPYLCIDYLYDGDDFYLSEVEVMGSVGGVPKNHAIKVLTDRFAAYRRAHAAHIAQSTRN